MFEIIFWTCMGLLCYSFLGYPMFLFILTRGRKPHKGDLYATPPVSILIAAYNEEKVISQKIRNLLDMDYPYDRLEIIIGSDNSSDATVAISESFSSTGRVQIFDFKKRRGKLGTLNAIAREAKGDILLLTDANCLFPKEAIRLLVAHFADPKVGCVAGEKTIIKAGDKTTNQGEGIYWKIESFLRQKESDLVSCAGADGAIYAVRKDLYSFPPENLLLMDDFIISLSVIKKGYRCIYERDAKAFEESSEDFRSEFRRKGRIFAGAVNALSLVPALLIPFQSAIALQLWSHKIFRWSGCLFLLLLMLSNIVLAAKPLYQVLIIPHIAFYCAGLLGLLLSVFRKKAKLFYIPFYFLFMNFSQLYGLFVLATEGQKGYWEKVGR